MSEGGAGGLQGLTPMLFMEDAAAAVDWYAGTLGARERMRMPGPGGVGVLLAELDLAGAILMVSDADPDAGTVAPAGAGVSHAIYLYVGDVDAVYRTALAAGATGIAAPEDRFWGDRVARIRDPFGHVWILARRVRDMTADELAAEARAFIAGSPG